MDRPSTPEDEVRDILNWANEILINGGNWSDHDPILRRARVIKKLAEHELQTIRVPIESSTR